MNSDDRLRRAAQEIDRATESLIAPPLNQVRRSARLRNLGVAVAAAVGAAVLVGGAVLALNPGSGSTVRPAGPGETSTTTMPETTTTATTDGALLDTPSYDGIPVAVPDLDPQPDFEMAGFVIDPGGLPEDYAADIEKMRASDLWDEFVRVDEIQFIGQVDGTAAYVLSGVATVDDVDDTNYACVLAVDEAPWGACNLSDDARFAFTNSEFPALVGWVGEGISAVSMDIGGGAQVWARTRSGFVFIGSRSGAVASVDFTAFGEDGSVVSGLWNYDLLSESSCSGNGLAPSALALSSVPQPVAQTLVEIVEAAKVCDFDTLEAVAGENFTASFGGDDASDLWTYEEEQGYEPMRWLMSILDLPHGTVDTGDETMYVWPAAAAHLGEWDTIPGEDLEALRSLYTDRELSDMENWGGYIGYRLGITETGVWSFFVAGD